METIFGLRITEPEMRQLFGYDKASNSMTYGFSVFRLPLEDYTEINSTDGILLDLALLFEHKNLQNEAEKVWSRIPDIKRQYKGGSRA